jgi:hypothetical protein
MNHHEASQLAIQNPVCRKIDAAITLSEIGERFPSIHYKGVPATTSVQLLDIYYEVYYRLILSHDPSLYDFIQHRDGRERETASLDEIDDIRNQLEGWIMCCKTIHVTPFCNRCGTRVH